MDVTRNNQEAAYQDLLALLPHCEFYALDLEMTGIRAPLKALKQREVAVLNTKKAKGLTSVSSSSGSYASLLTVSGNPQNKAAIAKEPLLAHSQLQPPCESYDEKIVAANTFNVVQLGLSLFFKKGASVLAPKGVDPLGNPPTNPSADETAVLATNDNNDCQDESAASSPTEKSGTCKPTPKRTHKDHSSNRQPPTVVPPLTSEGKTLWLAVDGCFASGGGGGATTSEQTQKALAMVTDFIVKQCAAVESIERRSAAAMTSAAGGASSSASAAATTLFSQLEDAPENVLETAAEIQIKMDLLEEHTNIFNAMTDAVQLRGLLEQFALSNAPPSSPSAPSAPLVGTLKWPCFDDLFTMKPLALGRKVPVPAKTAAGSSSSSSNAFGSYGGGGLKNIASEQSLSSVSAAATPAAAAVPIASSSSATNNNGAETSSSSAADEEQEDAYTVRAFSFYLFPHPLVDARDMTLNATTVGDFLANHSPISFDKWIKGGIHYVNREKLMTVRTEDAVKGFALKTLATTAKKNNSEGSEMSQLKAKCPSSTPQEILALSKFLAACRAYAAEYAKQKEALEAAAAATGAATAALPKMDPVPTPFLKEEQFSVVKSLLVELGMEKVGKTVQMSTRFAPKPKAPTTTAASPTGSMADNNGVFTPRRNALFETWKEKSAAVAATGTRVFEALISSKKPIIVQNGWSDLAFLYTAFHHPNGSPLDLPAFKTAIAKLFPTIYDSRTLATLEQFNGFSNRGRLERMYQSFQQELGNKISIYVPEYGQELFAPDEKTGAAAAHDASYDSFITGSLFLYECLALPSPADVAKFANIVPCYGSVFSLKLDDPLCDVWLTVDPKLTPIIRITAQNPADFVRAPRSLYANQTRVKSRMSKNSLPGTVQVPRDSELLYFVESTAKGLGGSLFDYSLECATAEMEKDFNFPLKVEVVPMAEALKLTGMTVRPFWPAGLGSSGWGVKK